MNSMAGVSIKESDLKAKRPNLVEEQEPRLRTLQQLQRQAQQQQQFPARPADHQEQPGANVIKLFTAVSYDFS